MIELLLASGLSCASSLELLNRVNEYSLRSDYACSAYSRSH